MLGERDVMATIVDTSPWRSEGKGFIAALDSCCDGNSRISSDKRGSRAGDGFDEDDILGYRVRVVVDGLEETYACSRVAKSTEANYDPTTI